MVLVVGLALAPALTACGADEEPSDASSSGDHNAADVTFASEMIQHHAQALVMVDLTVGRELDPEFQRLTEAIRDAQAPEIEVMADWLVGWGEEVPATDRDHVNAEHGDEGHGDLTELEAAEGDEFRSLWLEQMIAHHEGAIAMAETEKADGDYPAAVDLAETIIEAQSAEIERMQELLG
ncbi:Uncharacterized conserved protein, DUF305 family [Nocardioides szechwanensis]|uniref:Uncharacterized conserved protein, DUF305 family n=1 Tax=Nocardioides szechwanensis TaxID=1005944 RepID=A0A1H0CPV9_9ACTN|nr:Uncharacterized conserved protein, DUF305 family [Nocardioides szechwanensis]